MAARFWLGTTSTNWSTDANWAATSGGAPGAAVPTSSDDVTLDSAGNNPCSTTTADRVCLSFTVASGYTSTFTLAGGTFLSVSGNITIVSGFTFVNGGGVNSGLRMIAAGTWTTNGVTVPGPVFIGVSTAFTCTLADALTISGELTLNNTTSTTFSGAFGITATDATISGSQIVTLSGDVTINGTTTVITGTPSQIDGAFSWKTFGLSIGSGVTLQGAATLVFNGTGTWAANNTVMTIPVSIAAGAGTLTINGANLYSGTITYVSGTVNTTGSTLTIPSATTLNTAGMVWTNITLSAAMTLTLNSLLSVSGAFTLPNGAVTFAGSAGFTVATLTNTTYSATRITTFAAGKTYTVTGALFTVNGNSSAIRHTWVSSSPGTAVLFVLGPSASQDVGFLDPTDIDATGGLPVFTFHGVITTSPNWINQYPGGGGAGVRVFAYAG